MKILELFSGVGGMHYALKVAGVEAEVMAVEINTVANFVYLHNFPSANLKQKNILSLNAEELNKFGPEIILMSPPCQPFTRVGLKKDLEDARTDPLKHVLYLLPKLPTLSYILVENVKGFEVSEARLRLVACLRSLGFSVRELLISPTQISFPNMRTRYYLLAKRSPLNFCFEGKEAILSELPEEAQLVLRSVGESCPIVNSVEDILETDNVHDETFQEHLIPDSQLRRVLVMDVVTKGCVKTSCFTKAYGHYAEGTGSVYCPYDQAKLDKVFANRDLNSLNQDDVRELHLRYFTPREVARLMSFPDKGFSFPEKTTRKQKYRLLGNSVNVKVIALLIKLLLIDR